MSDYFLLWLTSNEIEKYYQVLIDNDINTVDLVKTLSIDDLKELGVSIGDRKRFEKACLVSAKVYTDFEQEIISHYPYVVAYPFKRMLDEPDGRNRLELMAYSFLNLMKYTGLVLASEYFYSSLRSKELNELFRNNLYQPSFGNWNAFVREAIKILSSNNLPFIFPEIAQAYSVAEIKNPKKYSVESEFTDEDGLLKLRKSELTAIGALINFRNRYLGHGMPLSKEEYAELYSSIYPVYTDLLKVFSCMKEMTMIKSDRLIQYLLQGDQVKMSENNQTIKEDSIWIQQGSEKKLPLIPFYIIPGKFNAGHTDKTQVLVYEQNTGQRIVFYSPESIKAEATGEILERLQLLLDNKEKEEPYSVDQFDENLFIERLRLHNDKTLMALKKEKKVIEGIYQSRGDAEMTLIGWSGAMAGFFFLAAEAGSGKTNLLVHVRERYQSLGYPSLLLRANRMEYVDLHAEICTVLNIPLGSDLAAYNIVGTQEKPFMILLDGANEHISPLDLLKSSAALADAFFGGGLKIVVSWRVNHLNHLPELNFSRADTLFRAENRQHMNPLAANAFVLKPMNLVELEGAWRAYTNHISKQFKPQFSFEDLLLADKPLVDQLSNPLLLRICMEIFHNKGLKSKPKGFTNLWKLWWQQIKNDTRESMYLLQLASLLAESRQLQVPLDKLFDHPGLSNAVNNLQVDSPHQQLLRKGIISQFFHEGILQVTFTMEAAYHYVLSVSLNENELGERVKESSFWEGPVKYKLWDEVYNPESTILFDLIDDDGFPNTLTGFALAQYVLLHGSDRGLQNLLSNPSANDWEVLKMALKDLEVNRPKEHIQLSNAVLKYAKEKIDDNGIGLLISLLQYGNKDISDDLYKSHVQHREINKEEELLALSAYHDKYGRNKEALALLEIAAKQNSNGVKTDAVKQAELFRLMAVQLMALGQYDKALNIIDQSHSILETSGVLNLEVRASLFNTRGDLFDYKSLYGKALSDHQTAHELYQQSYGPFHKLTLKTVYSLSKTYQQLGNYEKSMQLAEEGMQMAGRSFGELNPTYSDFVQKVGDLYKEKGNYDNALDHFTRALKIELDYFGESHPFVSGSYSRLGDIWNNKGVYDKALDYFERSMVIDLHYYGESHPNVAASLDRIGDIWNTKGNYDKALEYFERSMVIYLQYYGEHHPNVGFSLDRIGGIWETKGDYDKALDYYERSRAINIQYYGESHPNVGSSLDRIGGIWYTKGDYDKALEYFERSMVIRLQYYGESHPNVGFSLNRIGNIWYNKGDYDKALEYFELSLAIMLEYYGESHPNVAASLDRIGDIWNTKGNYDKALEYFERSMVIYLQYYGEHHPNVGFSLDRIGGIWETKGDYDKALDYYERSRAINIQYYGESHPNVGSSLDRIGGIWYTKGDYDKALEYYERSRAINILYYGEFHPNVGSSLDRIGGIWETKGDYDKALDYYERSLAIRLKYYGEMHPNVSSSLDQIGDIWDTKGDYDKALDYYERSRAINIQYYGENHPYLGFSLDRIGRIWETKGDYDKAMHYFERTKIIYKQYFGKSHPKVATIFCKIGDVWEKKGDYDNALNYFERAMAIDLQYYGDSHPNLSAILDRIGGIWEIKADYDKALEFYDKSSGIEIYFFGETHPRVASSLIRIGDILDTKGEYDKALEYFERALNIQIQAFGESHPDIGFSIDRIGNIWDTKGEYDKALYYFEQSLTIRVQYYGESHPDTGFSLCRIGRIWNVKNDYNKALNYFERAMHINIQYYGESHPELSSNLIQIGDIWRAKGDFDKALNYFERAMHINIQYYGESHPKISSNMVEIGDILDTKGLYENALEYYERAMVIYHQYYGESHPNLVGPINLIGDIWFRKADHNKAIEYFERALAINIQYYGKTHPNVGWSKSRLGDAYLKKLEYSKATTEFLESFDIIQKSSGINSRDTAKIKRRLGFLQIKIGQLDEGIDLISEALQTLKSTRLEKDIALATTYLNLSTGYRLQKNLSDSLASIEHAIEIFHNNRGEFHVDTAEAYLEYAQVFLAMGNLVSAKEYFQKAYNIRLAILGDNHPDTVDAKNILDEQN